VARRFVIVYGDQGIGAHNVGSLFVWAATTHKKEVAGNLFPGVPVSGGASIEVFHISSVPDLVSDLSAGDVAYLAYFGHSWDSWLFIGETATAGSNLSSARSATEAPVTDIPKSSFAPNAQIRLFGCRAGFGQASIASQLHSSLGLTVYGYENSGGSLFTQDSLLGHGQRAVTQADINQKNFKSTSNTWLVPINGTPKFRMF
jgi:hypothetical protein